MSEVKKLFTGSGRESKGVPASFHIIKRKDAARRIIEKTVKWWKDNWPLEYREYMREIKNARDGLANEYGMSNEGSLRLKVIMPTRVNIALNRVAPGFLNAGGREMWEEMFDDFRVSKRRPKFQR